MGPLNDVSTAVIMRSKNEFPHIERALRSLFQQEGVNFHLYNIDSGSTDGSWECILLYNRELERVVRIKPEEYQPGRVLNRMVALSKEPIVVFLNADAIPLSPFWLHKLIQPILEKRAQASYSCQIPRKDAHFIVKDDYARAYNEAHARKNPDFFSAVACAFDRDLWERERFYTWGFSEDLEWSSRCQKKGARFRFVPEAQVEHSHNYSFQQLRRRKQIEGEAEAYIYGSRPSAARQLAHFIKESARDLLRTLRAGKLSTIPYNLLYRAVAHVGFYEGLCQGCHRLSAPEAIQEGAWGASP